MSEFSLMAHLCMRVRLELPAVVCADFDVIEEAALKHALERDTIAAMVKQADRFRGQVFACDPDESCGCDTDDPKHPSWADRMADIHDMRAGK